MTETDISPNGDCEKLADQKTTIVVACAHGRTRSQAVARRIFSLGYQNVKVIGIRDPELTRAEVEQELKKADLVVATGADVSAEISHHADIRPILVPVPEEEHATMHSRGQTPREIMEKIDLRLTKAGFINFDRPLSPRK